MIDKDYAENVFLGKKLTKGKLALIQPWHSYDKTQNAYTNM